MTLPIIFYLLTFFFWNQDYYLLSIASFYAAGLLGCLEEVGPRKNIKHAR